MTNKVLVYKQIDNRIREIEKFEKNISRLNLIKKISRIAIVILFSCALLSESLFVLSCFSLINISSELLFGLSLISSFSTLFTSLPYIISSVKVANLDTPKTIKENKIIHSLQEYNKQFETLNPKKYLGKIEKIDLSTKSKVFIKADLQGDFKSLVNHLKLLRKKGYLDANFNVEKEYKNKIVLAFLGNFIGRGEYRYDILDLLMTSNIKDPLDKGAYSFDVLNLLLNLKINNPNEVLLIKGNHESFDFTKRYIHIKDKKFYDNNYFRKHLNRFFNSLPLAVFIGSKSNKKAEIQYTLLSHGAIDPDIDANELLANRNDRATMYIKKNRKANLSRRIKNRLPYYLKEDELYTLKKVLIKYIRKPSSKNSHLLKKVLPEENMNRKRAKVILSTLRVQEFLLKHKSLIETFRKNSCSSLTLGHITNRSSGFNDIGGACLKLNPEIIKDYFRTISSKNRKVKALRAGHAQYSKRYSINGKKGFIENLSFAGKLNIFNKIRSPKDYSEIITLKPKVKNWRRNIFIKKRNNSTKTFSNKRFYQSFKLKLSW